MDKKYQLIALSPKTYKELQGMGKMGETFDELVSRLLEQLKKA